MLALTVVPVTGLEPVRVLPHGILSPGRLPIPPHRQIGFYILPRTPDLVKKKSRAARTRAAKTLSLHKFLSI